MAYVYRLACFAVCLLLGSSAFASFAPTETAGWTTAGNFGLTPQASCAAYKQGDTAGTIRGTDPYGSAYTAPPYWCVPVNSWQQTYATTSLQCPTLSTLSGGVCVCTSPAIESGGSCSVPTAQSVCDGMTATGQVYKSGSVLSTTTCAGGFVAKGAMAAAGDGATNYIWGPFTCSGATCVAGPGNTASAAPPSPCLRPKISGTVNGVAVCLTPSSTMAVDSSKSAPAPAGAASGAASGLGGSAPAGATDSEKSTTCSGASCTTTTTFKDGGGSVISTQSETRPAPAFCVENPASPLCVQSSISQTSCGSSDACTGDAVQCAIQARAKETACAFDNSASAASEENAYTSAKGLTGDQTQGNDVNTTVAITSGSFDQTELMGAAAGLSDLSVTVMGRTTLLKMSMLNQWFSVLGYLLVGVTGLLCMRIVSRG